MDPLSSAALGAAYGAASKVAPELYKDTLQPLAQEVGKFLGSAGELINATLGGGLDVASEKSRQFWINISNQVKKKRDSIPIENRVEPTLGFIYSAHQGLYSSIDSESLGTSSRKRFDNKFDSFAESEQPLRNLFTGALSERLDNKKLVFELNEGSLNLRIF